MARSLPAERWVRDWAREPLKLGYQCARRVRRIASSCWRGHQVKHYSKTPLPHKGNPHSAAHMTPQTVRGRRLMIHHGESIRLPNPQAIHPSYPPFDLPSWFASPLSTSPPRSRSCLYPPPPVPSPAPSPAPSNGHCPPHLLAPPSATSRMGGLSAEIRIPFGCQPTAPTQTHPRPPPAPGWLRMIGCDAPTGHGVMMMPPSCCRCCCCCCCPHRSPQRSHCLSTASLM
mmetsp:Transcript_26973/g.54228  ORF Transcript_26973/g.54228 Transcript_26973/m.54228 type:complete len:229 (-) Transcript_26973:1121-1807(-)